MIVAAICSESDAKPGASFFDAIVNRQQRDGDEYFLVTQPDHAKLSGLVAAALDRERLPYIADEVVEAIATHDLGWLPLDGAAPRPILPPYEAEGRLRSFLTTPPELFLRAWTGSISHAEQIGPTAGTMVSQHFEQLAQFRLRRAEDSPEDVARLHRFLAQEAARQLRLGRSIDQGHATQLLRLLQFCDLISLYLCCGVVIPLEFPQQFGSGVVAIARKDVVTELRGVPLHSRLDTECPAFRWRPGSPSLTPAPISIRLEPVNS